MKFLTVRDLRASSARIWKELSEEKEMVVTNNGRPIAILSAVNESNLEESLIALRRAKAIQAVNLIQRGSVEKGLDKLSVEEISMEIREARAKYAK